MSETQPRDKLRVQIEPRQRLSGGSKVGSLQPVLFEGALEVSDAGAFTSLLTAGLGKSRGYGCGLLLVRRL
jgi:CRISPR-associated protein Cas6/Cse3/CasE subtype I-E